MEACPPAARKDDKKGVGMRKTADKATVRKSGIRAINQGKRYDCVGGLRRLEREIVRGDYGDVRDVVVAIAQQPDGDTSPKIHGFHFGVGSVAEAHWMISTMKNRLEPA